MGLLRSAQLTATEGGYTPTAKGHTINGVLLGEPILLGVAPITFGWDDSALPNGSVEIVDDEPVIAPDQVEEV